MTFEISWKRRAQRDLDSLSQAVASAVVEFVYGPLAENPYRVGKPLRFELEGLHSARRGNYRVIYQIANESAEISIIRVGHRADVYCEWCVS